MTESNYYRASANAAGIYQPLRGERTCDVCVVGGGMSGLSAALELVGLGYSVAVLEAGSIGAGASGRSGGQALIDVACGYAKLAELVGTEAADAIFGCSVEALELIRARVRRYQIDCDLRAGTMLVAQKPRQDRELLEELEIFARQGQSLQHYDRAKLSEMLASPLYTSALYNPAGLHLHPLNYTLGLAAAAQGAGVELFTNSRMLSFDAHQKIKVRCEHGLVHCRHLLLAGNCDLGRAAPRLRARIMPVGTYIAATRPLGAAAQDLIRNNTGVCDLNFVLDYFRLSADQRLLFGGRVSYSRRPPRDLRRSLRARIARVFPQIVDEPLEYAWGGYVDITRNRAPDFGRLARNVYYLQGFSGHGVALSNIAGKLVAEAIHQDSARFDIFSKIPHKEFPGGEWLRTPLLVLGMAWYRLRDWL